MLSGPLARLGRPTVARAGLAALALYLLAFAGLSFGGAKRNTFIVVAAAGCMLLVAALLQFALSRARSEQLLSRKLLLWGPVGVMVLGVGLVLSAVFGPPSGGFGFCGLCLAYIGAGHALTELRSRWGGAPKRGVIVMVICAGVFVAGLGLGLFVWAPLLAGAAVGLLGGPIGLTLYSEDTLRNPPRRLRRKDGVSPFLVPAGVALALLGAASLWGLAGIPPVLTVALVWVLYLLVGAIASGSQADVLIVVAVIALLWAASPRPVAPHDTIAVEPRQATLVALGDSYMAGEGAATFYRGTNESQVNECRRAPTAYAHVVVTDRPDSGLKRLAFYACSGARTRHLHKKAQYPGEPPDDGTPDRGAHQLAQLRALRKHTGVDLRLVVVSIGGNDAGFSKIGAACLAPGSCVERGQAWLNKLEKVERKVRIAYQKIRGVVRTDVPVLVVPYPIPIRPEPCDYSLLERDEHRFLFRYVQQLNATIERAARHAGFYYLDTMPGALSGKQKLRICDAPREQIGVNFIALQSVDGVVDQAVHPGNWIHNSLHPNERGHRVMADVLTAWLRDHRDVRAKRDPHGAPAPFVPVSLRQLMADPDLSYCGGRSPPDYCDRNDSYWAITQIGLFLAVATLPGVLVVLGLWLLWLPVLDRTRPRWERVGTKLDKYLAQPPREHRRTP